MTDAEEPQPAARALFWRAREDLLTNPAWIDYVNDVYSVDPEGYPFLTYVGLNFTKETIKNYKFYFSFFKRLSAEEIAKLLPVPDRSKFDEFYAQWHATHRYGVIHRGTTFAIKVDPDGSLTHYYHLRIRGLPFGPPERLTLSQSDVDNHHGVCEEFSRGKAHLKRYYYCRDKTTIEHSLELAGFGDLTNEAPYIESLEYIESEGRDKMAWITGSPHLCQALIDRRGPPRLGSGLAKIRYDCGFDMFGPGSATDGGDHSIYFVQPAGPLNAGGYIFDGVRQFAAKHLKLNRF